jgi:hypothetical protein
MIENIVTYGEIAHAKLINKFNNEVVLKGLNALNDISNIPKDRITFIRSRKFTWHVQMYRISLYNLLFLLESQVVIDKLKEDD